MANKAKFMLGQVVQDRRTEGRYAKIIRMDDLYCTLQADTYKYDVPIANVRPLTARERGPALQISRKAQ